MLRIIVMVGVILSMMFIISCAPRKLNPEAKQVKITNPSSNITNNCKFLGSIKLESIHGDMSLTASQSERALDDVNFLKNEGKKLGANVVTVLRHNSRLIEHQRTGKLNPVIRTITTFDIEAKAYVCPMSRDLADINTGAVFDHSDAIRK